jgi:hypothetical protein
MRQASNSTVRCPFVFLDCWLNKRANAVCVCDAEWVGGGLVFDETYIERTFAMLDHEMGISYYMLRADVDYSKIDPQGRLGSKEKVDRTQTVFCFRTHALLPTCDGLEEGRKHAYAAVTEHRDKKTKRGAIPLAQYKQWKKEASPGLFRFRVLQHIGEDSTVGDVF